MSMWLNVKNRKGLLESITNKKERKEWEEKEEIARLEATREEAHKKIKTLIIEPVITKS